MTDDKLTPDEAEPLWREARRRLRDVEVEPPLTRARLDALQRRIGPRGPSEDLRSWLRRGRHAREAPPAADAGVIVPFQPGRQRFRPVSRFTRLAADTAGGRLELPERELESDDGRFRMRVRREADQVVLELQALGFTTDQFAGRLVGLASPDEEDVPVAMVALDEDADGSVRLADTPELRRALLRPVIGLVEEA
ncbi:MAG TPA: hypothetical protein VFZ01_11245 [Geminicoccaceae bacterium]